MMLKTFFTNLKSYFKTQPKAVFANIDTTNIASQNLFKHFGLVAAGQNLESNLVQFKTNYEKVLETINSQEKEK